MSEGETSTAGGNNGFPEGEDNEVDIVRCPVCEGPSAVDEHLEDGAIRYRLSRVFGAPPPPDIPIGDYDLMRCQSCSLSFANPMSPGGEGFYGWITGFDRYHSGARWEWRKICDLVRGRTPTVIELGCGRGDLLHRLAGDGAKVHGLDISESSVAEAQSRGLSAHVGSPDDMKRLFGDKKFDVIILSHILEHVGDPRALMEMLGHWLAPAGRIFVAVPYSPMSLEIVHNNIMNLPPHHTSRWNQQSLNRLAELTGMTVRLHTRKPKPPLKRAWHFTWSSVAGTEIGVPVWRRIWLVASNGGLFFRLLKKAFGRERVNGRIAPDEVLADFSWREAS